MTAPRPPLVVLAMLTAAVVAATALVVVHAQRPLPQVATGAVAAEPAMVPPRTEAVTVLADWDRRRSAAWAAGDPEALARLYLPRSRAGRADLVMLARWRDRGLRVTGLRMQVLGVEERTRTDTRWELVVTDRVVGGVAVGRRTRVVLPRDGWSTRRITLEQVEGRWRVAAVRPEPDRR